MFITIRILLKDDTNINEANELGKYIAQHIKEEDVPFSKKALIGKVYYKVHEEDGTV